MKKNKTTELKKIGHLGIFVDGRTRKNRTYLLDSEKKVRRFDMLAASLIQRKMAAAQPGSGGSSYSLSVLCNIPAAKGNENEQL